MKARLATSSPAIAKETSGLGLPVGDTVVRDGEVCHRISGYHRMPAFLMSLASDTDLWMFVTAGGGLTAGRVDADGALFPYLTVDQLHDAHTHTGPITLVRVVRGQGPAVMWEPFGAAGNDDPAVERNLYKSATGHRVEFEEIRRDLGLAFRYSWAPADAFGWVRTAVLENVGTGAARVTLLDGLRNILPFGAPLGMYQGFSNLVDAYKRTEADAETGLGIFSLTAGITDRAEALEVLRANTVFCCGPESFRVHLAIGAIAAFRQGRVLAEDAVLCGARGNYLVSFGAELDAGASTTWRLVGDTGRDHVQVAALRDALRREGELSTHLDAELGLAGENLRRNVGSADGIQLTARREAWTHHFANVLFNNMRGGVFWRNHDVPVDDFVRFLRVRNAAVADRQQALLASLPTTLTVQALREAALASGDADFARLCHEYLPLHFGRRHGDPSRPWNRFSIRMRGQDGERELNYEGNWRDIFQNWEALGAAFPGFLPSLVAKFVNASTVDGFNPYRLTRDGVDWEKVSAHDPWSNIGYWGDHQVIYLLKLLEGLRQHDPDVLGSMLTADIFSYAEVPYRIRPYEEILADPRDTIIFDTARQARIDARVAAMGTDGRLLQDAAGGVHHASLAEKLLVPVLSKLSNLVPDAGIWMNTQRPEWNDANNALGGGGVSMVTLCYLRRYLSFLGDLLAENLVRPQPRAQAATLLISHEVATWFRSVHDVLADEIAVLVNRDVSPRDRKRLMDRLGGAFSDYRAAVYDGGFTGRDEVATTDVVAMCRVALAWVDHGIAANRRDDGLYHAYNLLEISADGAAAHVGHLPEMLEGQVAALSSGVLDPHASLDILDRLFASDLYRADQHSFLLYPARELPGFLAKNSLSATRAAEVPLLRDLLDAGEASIVARDVDGIVRFHGELRNGRDLGAALDALATRPNWAESAARDRAAVLELFEDVFNHKAYTGRSGAMYGYEGLGCIYWHMVAKLLLATQEVLLRAGQEGARAPLQADLAAMYFRIRAGLGYEKSVSEYGAFPADPYSHTPPDGGARQPGMTGQVKEEILTRFGELGVRVQDGVIHFRPVLLRADEFLEAPAVFRCFDDQGLAHEWDLPAGSLAFTYCQVPVVYRRLDGPARITVRYTDGTSLEQAGDALDARAGADVLARNGRVRQLEIGIPEHTLLAPGGSPRRKGDR
jgi:hypothetical protein